MPVASDLVQERGQVGGVRSAIAGPPDRDPPVCPQPFERRIRIANDVLRPLGDGEGDRRGREVPADGAPDEQRVRIASRTHQMSSRRGTNVGIPEVMP